MRNERQIVLAQPSHLILVFKPFKFQGKKCETHSNRYPGMPSVYRTHLVSIALKGLENCEGVERAATAATFRFSDTFFERAIQPAPASINIVNRFGGFDDFGR